MANNLLPPEERALTPAEVDALDRRRRRGQTYLVAGVEFLLIAVLVLCWSGQDATYSPGWARPMVYWNALLFILSVFCIVRGIVLRRGVNEFFSY